ncbi:MAG TPA: YbaK/EbsC family protein [Candidatus Acidoferrales bacterium]|nr:YbaK/EbsC family protein [Candidatus Acidoferrales bacterium]
MPILKRLRELLDEARIPYEVYDHALAYTAQEIAQRQHIPGREMAKVVILWTDGKYVMAVLPASRMISLSRAREGLAAKRVRLATEEEFASLFPGCEIGAMPPFGNLFAMPVYVDPELEKDRWIYFNAGNHVQTVKISYEDFKAVVRPTVVPLAESKRNKAA